MSRGGRNLLFLGLATIVISIATTTISLVLYHNSGDIYLDRSRPGFLPDKAETLEKPTSSEYVFPDNTPVNSQGLNDYLKAFKKSSKKLDQLDSSFSPDPLSDDSLGLTVPRGD